MTAKTITVCLDARLSPGSTGGVETLVLSLARALVALPNGRENYAALVSEENLDWARKELPESFELLVVPQSRVTKLRTGRSRFGIRDRLRKLSRVIRARIGNRAFKHAGAPSVFAERNPDVMHFLTQGAFITDVPSIYHPHDLQHLHLPDLFTDFQRAAREAIYPFFSQRAAKVCCSSQWVKRDLIAQYGLAPDSIQVINLPPDIASGTTAPADMPSGLPESFVLYPAQTWAHKNHITLLRAVARLRDVEPAVHCVFTGAKTEFFPTIEREIERLGIADRVTFLGFVSRPALVALYKNARMVAVPTRFEAASFPIWEAFASGTAVVSSNVTSLPEQTADAALVVDPLDDTAMAEAIRRVWTDDALRAELAARGKARVASFTWPATAERFRALYRRVAGTADASDNALLDAPPAF